MNGWIMLINSDFDVTNWWDNLKVSNLMSEHQIVMINIYKYQMKNEDDDDDNQCI